MLLHHFLTKTAEKLPDKEALIYQKNTRLTYAQIETYSNCLANALKASGLNPLDRVGIYLENSVESVISIFGVLKAGGIFSVINPQTKVRRLKYILNDCQVKVLVSKKSLLFNCLDNLEDLPNLDSLIFVEESQDSLTHSLMSHKNQFDFWELIKAFPNKYFESGCGNNDLCNINYTSGSTGNPKGVMLTHQNMISAAESIIEYLENTVDDVILNVLPLSFDYGLYNVLMPIIFGGKVVLEKSFISPHQMIGLVKKEQVNALPLVPTIVSLMLKFGNLKKYDLSQVKYITSTGQALPNHHLIQLQELFPKTKIYSMYGLTECKRVSYLPADELLTKPNSVGKAMPNVEVYLVDETGKKINQPGKIGELVIKGQNVMQGYWNLPQETAKVLRQDEQGEKVLYSGDYFQLDEDNYLYFVSRKDDMIKTSGERVSPKEIENILYQLEGIYEVAVYGVDDEILGQAIKIVIALKDNSSLTKERIAEYCSHNLEKHMLPKYIEIKHTLPKSNNGKIDKKLLKAS
ncbi:MAG: class I adenylate-forming enzyme family protein [Microcoleaceae cyanobacterium]